VCRFANELSEVVADGYLYGIRRNDSHCSVCSRRYPN